MPVPTLPREVALQIVTGSPSVADVGHGGAARPRLLLVDGHSIAYRAFYALPVESLRTQTGQYTNAVFGFTSMLINVLRDERPTHVGVAFDLSRQTFRSDQFPEYKANRSATPSEFSPQVALVHEVLAALGVPVLTAAGFEADDVIATVATRATAVGFEVLVLSGDRDSFQLVDDDLTVLYPKRGVSELDRMTPQAVIDRYGLTPVQYPDFAALRGDPSDNLPGIPGVGEKTATKWLVEFGSLNELVDHVDLVRGKAGDALRAHLAQVMTNRQLTELVRDVPIDVTMTELVLEPLDRERVHEVFDALEFRVLRERLFAVFSEPAPEPATHEGFGVSIEVLPAGGMAAWLTEHAPAETRTGLAVRGASGRGTGRVDTVALAAADGTDGWCELASLGPADRDALAAWLNDAACGKALHDAKGPLLALHAEGLPLAGLAADTALQAYLVLPGQRSFNLADLAERFLSRGLRVQAAAEGDQLSFGLDDDAASQANDLALQARAVVDLADALDARLAADGQDRLLGTVELPLVGMLADMERAGIAVDRPRLERLSGQLGAQVQQAANLAYAAIGHPVNLGSPKQLQVVLFDELGLPKTKKIKTGYTTDADALADLFSRTAEGTPGGAFLAALLRHRDVTRLKSVVDGLLPLVDAEDRIHTTFNQMIAATGRLSSTDPNLQNIPVRTAEGRQIRRCFVVGAGFETLLTADYSQIEMRIMAHLSGDTGLLEAFASGEDLHSTVASRVFSVDPDSVDAEQRRRIKAMSYGLAYGLSDFGLSQQLGISREEARGLMDEYFLRFGGVRDYLREVVEQARRVGYTETILGRRRYLPDLVSDNRQRREMAERMALNAPIQGSAADIMKVGMLAVAARLAGAGLTSRVLLQVHDELVLEVAAGEFAEVEAIVRAGMGGAAELSVPLEVSVGTGSTWEQAAH